jgi:hypothetical protein
MYNFNTYDTLRKCQRSFNVDKIPDFDFVNQLRSYIDDYIRKESIDVKPFVITDRNEIKLIYSCAIHEFEQPNLVWKTNTQVLAPLLVMCLPKKENDSIAFMQIGRLQSKLGALAIENGYRTGFCLCFNTRAMETWESLRKYILVDPITQNHIRPITLSIGFPYDENKPYNWSYIHNRSHPSFLRIPKNNIVVSK